jgi:hypothetical protein
MCLAHTVGNAVENAYRRSDLFNRRRQLLTDWASWCAVVQPDTSSPNDSGADADSNADAEAEYTSKLFEVRSQAV